jgi:hypothetical protein
MADGVEVTDEDKAAAVAIYNAYRKSGLPDEGAILAATHRINAVRPLVERGKALADVLDAMPPAALGPAAKLALTLFRTALQGVKQHDAETLS